MLIIIFFIIMMQSTRTLLLFNLPTTVKRYISLPNRQDLPRQFSPLHMALEMEVVRISRQSDLTEYWKLLSKALPDVNIVRWYIARFENGTTAVIEVVYDRNI